MKTVLLTLALSFCLLKALQAAEPRVFHSLATYFQKDLSKAAANATETAIKSKQCFALYLPLLEDLGAQWSTSYQHCLRNASSKSTELLANVSAEQSSMRASALGISNFISDCLNIVDALDFFNCFAQFSKEKLATVYSISFNASTDALMLTQQQSAIDVEKYRCTNDTEQSYVMSTAQVFDALDYCLEFGPPTTLGTTANSVEE